jgi:exonuclease VII small subunit
MSPDPDVAPLELTFGAAYERLQEVATELSADASMPPERLIALLKEGKGLERALRDHLDRIEQEVRAIDEGAGATPFRIVDGAAAAPAPASAPAERTPAPAERPAAPAPDAAPTLGFLGADDDIPF